MGFAVVRFTVHTGGAVRQKFDGFPWRSPLSPLPLRTDARTWHSVSPFARAPPHHRRNWGAPRGVQRVLPPPPPRDRGRGEGKSAQCAKPFGEPTAQTHPVKPSDTKQKKWAALPAISQKHPKLPQNPQKTSNLSNTTEDSFGRSRKGTGRTPGWSPAAEVCLDTLPPTEIQRSGALGGCRPPRPLYSGGLLPPDPPPFPGGRRSQDLFSGPPPRPPRPSLGSCRAQTPRSILGARLPTRFNKCRDW